MEFVVFWFRQDSVGQNNCMGAGGAGQIAACLGRDLCLAYDALLSKGGNKLDVGMIEPRVVSETKDDDERFDRLC